MLISDKFFAVNIREYFTLGNNLESEEPAFIKLLSGFSCPKNHDVGHFLKEGYRNPRRQDCGSLLSNCSILVFTFSSKFR